MTTNTRCAHKKINLIGNDESGLRSIRCLSCGAALTRRIATGGKEYIYEKMREPEQ